MELPGNLIYKSRVRAVDFKVKFLGGGSSVLFYDNPQTPFIDCCSIEGKELYVGSLPKPRNKICVSITRAVSMT